MYVEVKCKYKSGVFASLQKLGVMLGLGWGEWVGRNGSLYEHER